MSLKKNLKIALTFLGWPILTAPLIVGVFGQILNDIVTVANRGVMPVRVGPLAVDGKIFDVCPELLSGAHVCANHVQTHLWVLIDALADSRGWNSLGDRFENIGDNLYNSHMALYLWGLFAVYLLIRWIRNYEAKPWLE